MAIDKQTWAKLAESDDEHVRDLLRYGFILPYTNGTTWFEPHPVLRGMREGL